MFAGPVVMADVHERRRLLVDALEERGVAVPIQAAPIGDCVLSRRIGVE